MTEPQMAELSRCATSARRLLDGCVTQDVKTRLLSLASHTLADACGAAKEEWSKPTTAAQNLDEDLWNLTLAVSALRAQSDELRSIDVAVAALQLAGSTLADSAATIPARIQRLREIKVGGSFGEWIGNRCRSRSTCGRMRMSHDMPRRF
jgi:hypothetical protein